MRRPLSITVAPDEAPGPALVVKLLLTGCGLAVGVGLGMATSREAAEDPRSAKTQAEARSLADDLERHMHAGRSCTDALTQLGVALVTDDGDAWGQRWTVRCYGELGVVHSRGPDGRSRTVDDIVALASPDP